MIKVYCRKCNKELDEQGSLVFGIPNGLCEVSKNHICTNCHSELMDWMDNVENIARYKVIEILEPYIHNNKECKDISDKIISLFNAQD